MKTKRFYPLLGLILVFLIASCGKTTTKPASESTKPIETKNVEITFSKNPVVCGDSIQIRIVCKTSIKMSSCYLQSGGAISGELNGPFDRTFKTGPLLVPTELVCYFDGENVQNPKIQVTENPADISRNNILTSKPWKIVEIALFTIDKQLISTRSLSKEEINDDFYYLDHSSKSFHNGELVGCGFWLFQGDNLLWDGNVGRLAGKDVLEVFSDNKMVAWRSTTLPDGKPGLNRITSIR